MTTTMDYKTLNKQNNLNLNVLVEQISIQQLVDLSIDSLGDKIGQETREELIKRGKDNIPVRIQIKKACKASITNIESLLKEIDEASNNDKSLIRSYKTRFLNSLSVLDKLQLEWQKHDLGLNLH